MTKLTFSNQELQEIATLKEAYRKYRVDGTVEEWNELRAEAKEHYPEKIISAVDASGFMVQWMKEVKNKGA